MDGVNSFGRYLCYAFERSYGRVFPRGMRSIKISRERSHNVFVDYLQSSSSLSTASTSNKSF